MTGEATNANVAVAEEFPMTLLKSLFQEKAKLLGVTENNVRGLRQVKEGRVQRVMILRKALVGSIISSSVQTSTTVEVSQDAQEDHWGEWLFSQTSL